MNAQHLGSLARRHARIIWQKDDIAMYATSTSTYFLVGDEYCDIVVHESGHCHLCGFSFSPDCPESQIRHWCVECYKRFVCDGGRVVIVDMIESSGYGRQGGMPEISGIDWIKEIA